MAKCHGYKGSHNEGCPHIGYIDWGGSNCGYKSYPNLCFSTSLYFPLAFLDVSLYYIRGSKK